MSGQALFLAGYGVGVLLAVVYVAFFIEPWRERAEKAEARLSTALRFAEHPPAPESYDGTCPECGGYGEIWNTRHIEETRKCEACGGVGSAEAYQHARNDKETT